MESPVSSIRFPPATEAVDFPQSACFPEVLCHIEAGNRSSGDPSLDQWRAIPLLSYTASVEPAKLSSPRIFLFRMLVFLTLCGLLLVVLYKQIWARSSPIRD